MCDIKPRHKKMHSANISRKRKYQGGANLKKCGFVGKGNQTKLLSVSWISKLMMIVTLMAVGCGLCSAIAGAAPVVKPKGPSILSKCRADLAKRLKVKTQDIKLADAQTVTWPDAALGMPEIGKVYAQVQTPGQKLILQVDNRLYLYTTSDKAYRYGGPLPIWGYSMLYLQSVENEPNLNGDLYQCSLLGTNSIRLLSGVTDYYPQDKGTVIAKRRTSRSGHDLLYVEANKPGKEKMLYQAMDFGEAAFNSAHDQWAGYVRPRLGTEWTVVIGRVGQEASKARVLPMPDNTKPVKIAWSDDTLMILVKEDLGMIAFETNPKAESSAWKQVGDYNFPGQNRFVLNKSETLEINEIKENGKPGFEVVRVWFTGDRNEVAKITDFTMQGYDLLGPYAFIWGEKNSRHAAYSVDISSGDSVVGFTGDSSNIKPFTYPPHNSPIPKAPIMD